MLVPTAGVLDLHHDPPYFKALFALEGALYDRCDKDTNSSFLLCWAGAYPTFSFIFAMIMWLTIWAIGAISTDSINQPLCHWPKRVLRREAGKPGMGMAPNCALFRATFGSRLAMNRGVESCLKQLVGQPLVRFSK